MGLYICTYSALPGYGIQHLVILAKPGYLSPEYACMCTFPKPRGGRSWFMSHLATRLTVVENATLRLTTICFVDDARGPMIQSSASLAVAADVV